MLNLTLDEKNLVIQRLAKYAQDLDYDIHKHIDQDYPNYEEYLEDKEEYETVCRVLEKMRNYNHA